MLFSVLADKASSFDKADVLEDVISRRVPVCFLRVHICRITNDTGCDCCFDFFVPEYNKFVYA